MSVRRVWCGFGIILLATVVACGSSLSSSDIKYVAIGASDAAGFGASSPTRGYVYLIEDQLDQQCGDSEVINLGIPGAEADVIDDIETPAAVELDPELITVWVGGNDLVNGRSVESFESDLQNILQELRSETMAALFVANLPDLTKLPRFVEDPDPNVTAERVAAYNEAIARQTAAVQATLVDLFSIELTDVLVSGDGFHPNDQGHITVASAFLEQILPQVCMPPQDTGEAQ